MKIEDNEEFGPVCKFGPGGGFVKGWPPYVQGQTQSLHSGLGRVLASLSLIINKLRPQQQFKTARPPIQNSSANTGEFFSSTAITEFSTENPYDNGTIDTETNTVVEADSRLPGEPLLFADDIRAGMRIRNKSKHHVRAHRRTTKKRHGLHIIGQGSLFDADGKSARIA